MSSELLIILEFGQDAKRGSEVTFPDDSAVEAIMDKLEMAEENRSHKIEEVTVRKDNPEREVQGMRPHPAPKSSENCLTVRTQL